MLDIPLPFRSLPRCAVCQTNPDGHTAPSGRGTLLLHPAVFWKPKNHQNAAIPEPDGKVFPKICRYNRLHDRFLEKDNFQVPSHTSRAQ